MTEYEKVLEELKTKILSLSDDSDVKEQALYIIDNPEGNNGILSIKQLNKLQKLVDLGKEACDIITKQAEDENAVIGQYQESVRDTFSEVQEEIDTAINNASDNISKSQ